MKLININRLKIHLCPTCKQNNVSKNEVSALISTKKNEVNSSLNSLTTTTVASNKTSKHFIVIFPTVLTLSKCNDILTWQSFMKRLPSQVKIVISFYSRQ